MTHPVGQGVGSTVSLTKHLSHQGSTDASHLGDLLSAAAVIRTSFLKSVGPANIGAPLPVRVTLPGNQRSPRGIRRRSIASHLVPVSHKIGGSPIREPSGFVRIIGIVIPALGLHLPECTTEPAPISDLAHARPR